jgi:hypothetical protein
MQKVKNGRKCLNKETLLNALTQEEIRILTKSPFKRERNRLIYEIYQMGISCHLLGEITGLGHTIVHRIGTRGPEYGLRRKARKPGGSI